MEKWNEKGLRPDIWINSTGCLWFWQKAASMSGGWGGNKILNGVCLRENERRVLDTVSRKILEFCCKWKQRNRAVASRVSGIMIRYFLDGWEKCIRMLPGMIQ